MKNRYFQDQQFLLPSFCQVSINICAIGVVHFAGTQCTESKNKSASSKLIIFFLFLEGKKKSLAMSIAVERVQNYYQYKDAEAKFYQVRVTNNCLRVISLNNVWKILATSENICVISFCVFLMQAAKKR